MFLIEMILRFVLEVVCQFVFELLCHMTGRLLLWVFSWGRIKIREAPNQQGGRGKRIKLTHLSRATGRGLYVDFDTATIVGVLFWVVVVATCFVVT